MFTAAGAGAGAFTLTGDLLCTDALDLYQVYHIHHMYNIYIQTSLLTSPSCC